jgi:hypothetical protein
MVRVLLVGGLFALPEVAAARSPASDPEAAAAALMLLWLGLFAASGLLLFWGLPLGVAALIARHRRQHLAAALLWAGALGWVGILILLYRSDGKCCPHCHTRVVAGTALCYWCGGDTRPTPMPVWVESGGW